MAAEYEHVPVPPEGRPATAWERENMIPAEASGDVDYGDLDDASPEWVRLPSE
ncbi:hypothetical protein [Streptomyces viridosporus]|uniref:hypothetical protein n=1 Tax=Streptomyces viridosporus TaxID=67581 RepID=UPI0001AF20C6|nr:hypothetical protein [Streptomyces viridosporus]